MPIQLCTSLIGFSSCTPQVDLLYTEPYGSVYNAPVGGMQGGLCGYRYRMMRDEDTVMDKIETLSP